MPICHCQIFGCLITREIMYLLIVFLPLLGSFVAGCFGRFLGEVRALLPLFFLLFFGLSFLYHFLLFRKKGKSAFVLYILLHFFIYTFSYLIRVDILSFLAASLVLTVSSNSENSSPGWTSLLGSTSQEPSSPRGVWTQFEQEANSRGSSASVNQPLPAEQANPVAPGEAEAGPSHVAPFPYHEEEVIGGDSVLSIKRRLLAHNPNPSAFDIYLAEIDAQDRFEVKADIAIEMSSHDPTGDWVNRGARALDNPRTKTGEESLEKLLIIREKLRQRDWETINNLKAKMVFLKGGGG
nr:hypothetical protein [Solanum melongena]WMB97156.1 hypothetical protein [Solanum aethiopicum]